MKKIFFSLFACLMCFNFLGRSVEASTVEYPPFTEEILGYKYYVIYSMNKEGLSPILLASDSPIHINSNEQFSSAYKYELTSDGRSWYKSSSSELAMWWSSSRGDTIWYSSHDVNKGGELFFSKKPIPQPGELEGAIQKVPMGMVMEVVKEVAPIVVLSIVSYLGLRKAFRWLLLQLKGC